MKLTAFLATCLLTLCAYANEVKVCTISSNIDPEKGDLYIDVVGGKIDSMRIFRTVDGKETANDHYPIANIMAGEGIIATERLGWEVVRLYLEDFDLIEGGIVKIEYLYNALALRNKRRSFKVRLVKSANGFIATDLEGKKFNRVYFTENVSWGRSVGVESYRTECVSQAR